MKAFENCERTKDELLASLAAHRWADNLVQGTYWRNGRGCAVGCSIHDFRPGAENRHSEYEPLFGIPKELARLEDRIFEDLPIDEAREWPERFVNAIKPGTDLKNVYHRFCRQKYPMPGHWTPKEASMVADELIELIEEAENADE